MENQGYTAQPASGTGFPTPTHPELYSGTTPEKKGMADKVKGLLGGHGHKTDATAAHHQSGTAVYGDATPSTGTAEATRVGCLDKIKAKAGIGHGLAPEQTRAHRAGQDYTDPNASPDFNGGTNVNSSAAVHGGWPQPTNPTQGGAGYAQPHHSHAPGMGNPNQAMATGGYGDPQSENPYQSGAGPHHSHAPGMGSPNEQAMAAGGYGGLQSENPYQSGAAYTEPHHSHAPGVGNPNQQAMAAGGYGDPQSENPYQSGAAPEMGNPHQATEAGGYGGSQPANPTGMTNAQGGAVLGDHHGNVQEGPREDTEKKEGFVSKIMDKLHSPKGKPANTATTTPTTY